MTIDASAVTPTRIRSEVLEVAGEVQKQTPGKLHEGVRREHRDKGTGEERLRHRRSVYAPFHAPESSGEGSVVEGFENPAHVCSIAAECIPPRRRQAVDGSGYFLYEGLLDRDVPGRLQLGRV